MSRSISSIARRLTALGAVITIHLAVAAAPSADTILPLPDDWYPESAAVDDAGNLYVGSWRQGAVARLRPGASGPGMFVAPGSNGLSNAQGLLVDGERHLLWVCSGMIGFTTVPQLPSALKAYDLATGAPRASYPLPQPGHCNDLAQDGADTIYVTDSFAPRILRLRRGASALETWKSDPAFGPGPEGYFLNGIAIDDQDRLYVGTVAAGAGLLRVAIASDGSARDVERIAAPRVLKNADGIRWAGRDRLVVFESNAFGEDGPYGGRISVAHVGGDRIDVLTTLVAGLDDPSGGVVSRGRLWYFESKYGLLFAHRDDEAAIPRGVPFGLRSIALP